MATRCRSFEPGHNVHPRRPHPAARRDRPRGRLLVDERSVVLVTDEDLFPLTSHDPDRLRALADRYSYLEWELAESLLLPANRAGLSTYPVTSVVVAGEPLLPCAA